MGVGRSFFTCGLELGLARSAAIFWRQIAIKRSTWLSFCAGVWLFAIDGGTQGRGVGALFDRERRSRCPLAASAVTTANVAAVSTARCQPVLVRCLMFLDRSSIGRARCHKSYRTIVASSFKPFR
jgi:hypothetical protein